MLDLIIVYVVYELNFDFQFLDPFKIIQNKKRTPVTVKNVHYREEKNYDTIAMNVYILSFTHQNVVVVVISPLHLSPIFQ